MAKETLGLKLAPEVAAKFKEIQVAAGGTAQDFIETLLAAHAKQQEDTNTASPVYKEQVKVRQALASVERVVGSYLELAAHDKVVAEEKARDAVEVAQAQVAELKDEIENGNTIIKDLKATNEDLTKTVTGLEEKAEALETLKAAWVEKEALLNARVTDLDAEAKQARELAGKVADLEKELVEKNFTLALAMQKMEGQAQEIQNAKDRLGKKDTRIETLEKALDAAKDQVNQEKVNCSIRISEVQTAAAEEKGRLSGELASVKGQLENQKQLQEKATSLESQLKDAVAENTNLGEQVKGLQAELKKGAKK